MDEFVKHESSIDRLSGLPDSVLSHILSFLPTTQSVRTSILSTRWRYLYTSVTTLDIVNKADNASDGFMNFVDRLLIFHDKACIQRFHLRCYGEKLDAYRICTWISFALRRDVQELILKLYFGDRSGFLPAALFTQKTLVKLVLRGTTPFKLVMSNIPTKVCLPSLKTLCLKKVGSIDDDSFRRLISGCIVLEELYIFSIWDNLNQIYISNPSLKRLTIKDDMHVYRGFNIVIDAPSLVYLRLEYIAAENYLLTNLHSLVRCDLKHVFTYKNLIKQDITNIATNFLKGIRNVQSLDITSDIVELFTLCNKPQPVFCNLVCLDIWRGYYSDGYPEDIGYCYWNENELIELLGSSPNLETLILDMRAFHPSNTIIRSCLLPHLRKIEINLREDGYSDDSFLTLVEYFLKNASGLEKLTIQMRRDAMEQFEIAKKVLMFPRESKICQVEIV